MPVIPIARPLLCPNTHNSIRCTHTARNVAPVQRVTPAPPHDQTHIAPPKARARATDAGFTLIETLVALAILAMSAMALLGAAQAHVARIGALETRAAAQWAVENHLAELNIGATPPADPAPMMGIAFTIADTRSPTTDPDLEQVQITATDQGDGQIHGRLTGFVLRRPGG